MIPLRRHADRRRRTTSCPTPKARPAPRCCAPRPRARRAARGSSAGMAVGAAVKLLVSPCCSCSRARCGPRCPCCPRPRSPSSWPRRCFGVGFILGYRQSAVCMAGAVIVRPGPHPAHRLDRRRPAAAALPRDEAPRRRDGARATSGRAYVRYIGAGAVATAGILTVLRGLPAMAGAFLAVARGLGTRSAPASGAAGRRREDRSRPARRLRAGRHRARGPRRGAGARRLRRRHGLPCNGRSARRAWASSASSSWRWPPGSSGSSGVSSQPTSGITLVTLLGVASVFAAAGWTDPGARAAVLTVGTIVAVAASKAGRHLAGPEDRLPGGGHPRPAAVRPADRGRVRLLGGGRRP